MNQASGGGGPGGATAAAGSVPGHWSRQPR